VKLWWLTDSRRFAQEKAALEALAAAEPWFELGRWAFVDGNLAAIGIITAPGVPHPVQLIYPDQFPDVPAWVEPQDREAKWSSHQYGAGGTLCLELRPDNWVRMATGADVLRSAYNLLTIENPLGEGGGQVRAPSAHHIGQVQSYDWNAHPVLVSAGCRERLGNGVAVDVKALGWMAMDEIWPILIHDEQDRSSARRPPAADVASWRFEISVYLSGNVAPTDGLSDRAALTGAAGLDADTSAVIIGTSAALVLFTGGQELVAYHLVGTGGPHRRRVFVLPDESGARSGRSDQAMSKRVVVVGAGSVGSKIAESLIRSGVERLTLVDGDVMLPGNLERHALDWRDVGFRKAHGVKRRLLAITPGADIIVVDQNLNWQRSARTHAWQIESIADCAIIVDATGDPATSLFLGSVAASNGRPFVFVEVFEGGIGALVASCLPDRDPTYTAARAAFLAWCDEGGEPPPAPAPRDYEALASDGTPMVADDAAVTITAGHAARVILDILDGQPAGPEAAWLLFGYRKAWRFDGHGHTIRLSVGKPSTPQPDQVDRDAQAFVLALAEEYLDARSDSA
jgi:sulfur-carrier protein adenylyltransferase/sulfurtransferase